MLREARGRVVVVQLVAPETLVEDRMQRRRGHFMPPGLLPSQYQALEPLTDAEDGFVVAVDAPPEQVADRVLAALQAGLTERRPS